MKPITHPIYKDYPEQPYISPQRDLETWAKHPHRFPYGIVEKRQMKRLPEGILPGHVIMLWRVHFDTFTNQSVIPQYFEYRYGVNSGEVLKTLTQLGYIYLGTAVQSLDALNMGELKEFLAQSQLDTKGKKADVLQRLKDQLSEEQLASLFSLRKYKITPAGEQVLQAHDAIIQRHGPKMG